MKKLFISADIEGTCGIAAWDETHKGHPDYERYALRMSREVAAACEGALEGGMDLVMVRDAHGSARNLTGPACQAGAVIRGWGQDPLCMMSGLDESFYGAVFTGYHDLAGSGENPLSHTMSTSLVWLTLNGEPFWAKRTSMLTPRPFIECRCWRLAGTAASAPRPRSGARMQDGGGQRGAGNLVHSIHPEVALVKIREAVRQACQERRESFALNLPDTFRLDVRFSQHAKAYSAGFYPGVKRLDSHTLRYEADDWYEVLRMMHFCL